MNKKVILFKCLALAALIVALVLEALPFGAALMFVINPETKETKTEYYSYFDFTPFGYANFAPLITAVLTVMLTAASLVLVFIKRKSQKVDFTFIAMLILTIVISIGPLFTGIDCYTITGIFITLSLIASAILYTFSMYAYEPNKSAKE